MQLGHGCVRGKRKSKLRKGGKTRMASGSVDRSRNKASHPSNLRYSVGLASSFRKLSLVIAISYLVLQLHPRKRVWIVFFRSKRGLLPHFETCPLEFSGCRCNSQARTGLSQREFDITSYATQNPSFGDLAGSRACSSPTSLWPGGAFKLSQRPSCSASPILA